MLEWAGRQRRGVLRGFPISFPYYLQYDFLRVRRACAVLCCSVLFRAICGRTAFPICTIRIHFLYFARSCGDSSRIALSESYKNQSTSLFLCFHSSSHPFSSWTWDCGNGKHTFAIVASTIVSVSRPQGHIQTDYFIDMNEYYIFSFFIWSLFSASDGGWLRADGRCVWVLIFCSALRFGTKRAFIYWAFDIDLITMERQCHLPLLAGLCFSLSAFCFFFVE